MVCDREIKVGDVISYKDVMCSDDKWNFAKIFTIKKDESTLFKDIMILDVYICATTDILDAGYFYTQRIYPLLLQQPFRRITLTKDGSKDGMYRSCNKTYNVELYDADKNYYNKTYY
jgi:hypothetical protein